eukprot:COSAG03_NODE_26948_length_256_cov_0.649682_1_plen_47_part_10
MNGLRAPAPCGRYGSNAEACTYEMKVSILETGVPDKQSNCVRQRKAA